MQTRKRFLPVVITGVILLALIALPIGIGLQGARQEERNVDLIVALRTGQVEEARSLLEQGADPNARDLPDAPQVGLWQHIVEMVTHPPHPERAQAKTALTCACDSKQAAVLVKLLLDHGASIKADEACERPALEWAGAAEI